MPFTPLYSLDQVVQRNFFLFSLAKLYCLSFRFSQAPPAVHGGFGKAWLGGESSLRGEYAFFLQRCSWFGVQGWFVFPYSVFLSSGSGPTNSCQPPQQRDRQGNQKTNTMRNEIQNMFRETCYFKGKRRSPPGAHYCSQRRGGVRENAAWESVCILFQQLQWTSQPMNNPPISFHGPTDPGLLSILAPQSPQRWAGQMYWGKMLALRHTYLNPSPSKLYFT